MSDVVAVTGIGVVSAFGAGYSCLVDGVRSGRRAIGPVSLFDVSDYRSRIAAEIRELPPVAADRNSPIPGLEGWREPNRTDRIGLFAAGEALAEAGLGDAGREGITAISFGAGNGGMLRAERFLAALDGEGERTTRLRDLMNLNASLTADAIAARFGLHGPRLSMMTACSSSANAIAAGRDLLRLGRADVVLAGGADTLCELVYAGFSALRALDAEPCRPFDRARAGLTLGEGAAFLVLEPLARARARGARIRAVLLGTGNTMDAHHLTAPAPDGRGAARALELALEEAADSLGLPRSVVSGRVSYVNAHGTATPHNDPAEAAALHTVFGDRASALPVSSSKSQLGHCLSAAGAMEASVTIAALESGFLPATAGLTDPDPACDLGHVTEPTDFDWGGGTGLALSNSFAFGGSNSVLCFGREEVLAFAAGP